MRKTPRKEGRQTPPTPYKSNFEYKVSKVLEDVPAQFTYEPLSLEYVLKKNYTPDFVITRPDGTELFVESKGYFDSTSREKMIAVKEQHPELEIVILFMSDKPINKKSGFKYSNWAEKHGFDYSIGTIPLRWIYGEAIDTNNKEKEIPIGT